MVGVGLSVIENILALNLTPTLMFMVGVGLSGKETNKHTNTLIPHTCTCPRTQSHTHTVLSGFFYTVSDFVNF